MTICVHRLACAITAVITIITIAPSHAIDWQQISEREVVLLQPGQTSWEWMHSGGHAGASMVKQGRNCRLCHSGQEALLGQKIIANKALEPQPLAGADGSLVVKVKVARDGDRIFFRLSWPASNIDNKPVDPAEFHTRLSLLFDDGSVKDTAAAGCWISCHSDNAGMANAPPAASLTKYLANSRLELGPHGGGSAYKSADELNKLRVGGAFLEYWQVDLNPGADPIAIDGTVLEERRPSAASQLSAEATFTNGVWTIVVSRALTPGETTNKDIVPAKTYTFGLAVHENFARGRQHFVSFEHSFALDKGAADFIVAP